jgi:hypothetical protein
VVELERELYGLPTDAFGRSGFILRKFFCYKRGDWTECRQAWCGKCYKALDNGEFPVSKPVDEDGVEVGDPADDQRYLQARNGDNLVTPFQCDLCHFRNLMQHDPVEGLPQDMRLLKLIRHANLDALWSRELGTVRGTLSMCQQGGRIAASLGFKDRLFWPMGPHPLKDTFGIGVAIVMLQQSLAPGKYDKTRSLLQFASSKVHLVMSITSHQKVKRPRLWRKT